MAIMLTIFTIINSQNEPKTEFLTINLIFSGYEHTQ